MSARRIVIALGLVAVLLCAVSCRMSRQSKTPAQQTVLSRADSLFKAKVFVEWGHDQYSYEDYDSALAFYDSALKYNPELSQGWHGRGLMLDHLGRDTEAIIPYQNAEKFDSTNRQAIWHLGCLYARAGKKEKALRQLRTVIALDSGYAVAVRSESCWTALWNDLDFLATVGEVTIPSETKP